MIDFKKSFDKLLPYDRAQYIKFLGDDPDSPTNWYGVSFQLPGGFEGKEIGLPKFIEHYEGLFKDLVLKLDNGSFWIVNHDYKGVNWLPNNEDNLTLLRTLFKESNVPNTFKGALIFTKDELLKFSVDLISYPYAVFNEAHRLYPDVNISHGELPFIIKISGHLNIDFLSTNLEMLIKIVNEHASSPFIIKEYRGTSLS
jgi:hypothetical protein